MASVAVGGPLARETKVENLHLTVARHEDVVGLQIAMHDALVVSGGQAPADLHGIVHRRTQRERCTGRPLAQRGAVEHLHGGIRNPVKSADVVNRDDVGMRERGQHFDLAVEPLPELRIAGHL